MVPYDRYEHAYADLDERTHFGYIVIFEPNKYLCSFTIWQCGDLRDGTFLYNCYKVYQDIRDMPPLFSGSIKWDGCANMYLDDEVLHTCGLEGLKQFTDMLMWIYGTAPSMIEKADPGAFQPETR